MRRRARSAPMTETASVLRAVAELPPITRDLLATRVNQVAAQRRREVAGNARFHIQLRSRDSVLGGRLGNSVFRLPVERQRSVQLYVIRRFHDVQFELSVTKFEEGESAVFVQLCNRWRVNFAQIITR